MSTCFFSFSETMNVSSNASSPTNTSEARTESVLDRIIMENLSKRQNFSFGIVNYIIHLC